MNRRKALQLAVIGTAANACYLAESQGGAKTLDRYDQAVRRPAPCTHTLELFQADGSKEVLVQEGATIHAQLVQHLHEQVDKLTDSTKGLVSTKIVCHGNVTRIEIEQVRLADG